MARRNPQKAPPAEIDVRGDEHTICETRDYALITPLFGGGVQPQQADPLTVVRASEVRGQLRFWWRATRGGAFGGDLAKMHQKENALWGSTESPSRVIVEVETRSAKREERGHPVPPANPADRKEFEDRTFRYVTFPLLSDTTPGSGEAPGGHGPNSVVWDVSFSLTLRYPQKEKDEVEAALWAWETFGGIGGRTRRGFGAISREGVAPEFDAAGFEAWLRSKLQEHVRSDTHWPAGVPHLSIDISHYRLANPTGSPIKSWKFLVGALQRFRQTGARVNRPGGNRPGSTLWPEPGAIRRRVAGRQPTTRARAEDRATDKFPRAVMGLPILFQMRKDPQLREKRIELRGQPGGGPNANIDRLASPLILRPVACKQGFAGLACVLEWEPVGSEEPYTPPGGVYLWIDKVGQPVSTSLDPVEAAQVPVLKGEVDVLKAFLNYLTQKGP